MNKELKTLYYHLLMGYRFIQFNNTVRVMTRSSDFCFFDTNLGQNNMLNKTELEQKVILDYNGNKALGKIIKVYGQENPYQPGMFAKINISTPHGSVLRGGIAWFRDPTDEELTQLKEYEDDAISKDVLYKFDEDRNVEY